MVRFEVNIPKEAYCAESDENERTAEKAGDFRYQADIQAVISILGNLVMRISRVFQRETASLLANTDANS